MNAARLSLAALLAPTGAIALAFAISVECAFAAHGLPTNVSDLMMPSNSVQLQSGAATQAITVPSQLVSVAKGAPSFNLNAKAKTKLSYESSDERIATVSSSGTVKAGKTGTATITITARETPEHQKATKKVRVRVSAYKPANGKVAHAGSDTDGKPGDSKGDESCVTNFFKMKWNFIVRCNDPYVADCAATAVQQIVRNEHFGYSSCIPTSQKSVDKRASVYKAVLAEVGKNPSKGKLKKISSVRIYADTSCTPTVLAGYWLYFDMDAKMSMKWRPPYDVAAYRYSCGAPNVESHQLERAIAKVNESYRATGKLPPFKIIYVPKSKRSSFFSKENIFRNLKRGDIVCACPDPKKNGHTAIML